MKTKIPSYQRAKLLKFDGFSWSLIKKVWHIMRIECGRTDKKAIVDPKTKIVFWGLFNQKRMMRHSVQMDLKKYCPLCNKQQLNLLKMGKVGVWDLICNKYPLVPYHLLFNSKIHRVNPSLQEVLSMLWFSQYIFQERILLSPGPKTGAGVPLHIHAHSLPLQLPLEKAKAQKFYSLKSVTLSKLAFPAWGLKISGPLETLGRVVFQLIRSSQWPLNFSIVNGETFIIPRRKEMPEICKGIVDGVGALATAGLYTLCDKEALEKVGLKTFIEGLREATFTEKLKLQTQFVDFLNPLIEKEAKREES